MPDIDACAWPPQIVRFVQALRKEDLEKVPGIAETLDWAAAALPALASQVPERGSGDGAPPA